jgi:hypothetical protein
MAVFSFFLLISLIIHKSFVKLGPFNHVLKILFCLAVQCSRSVPFWSRSGFADPYHGLADPDPDPAILVSDLHDAKKINFFAFFEGTSLHLHHSSKLKCHKKV